MNLALLMTLAMVLKEPPQWYEAVYLHEALLPGTVTTLSATEDFISVATDLVESAKAHRSSDTNAKTVHQNYRTTAFGEHIVITPNQEPELIKRGDSLLSVLSIVVGFRRGAGKVKCEFSGLFIIDAKGLIHEHFNIPDVQKQSFEHHLNRWLRQRIQAVEAARARARK